MSWQASKAVWQHCDLSGNAKLLMLAIADHADAEGEAWPGIARLASMVGVGPRSIKRLIKQCEESGDLRVERSVGRGNSSTYYITSHLKGDTPVTNKKVTPATPFKQEKVTPVAVKGDTADTLTIREPSQNNDVDRWANEFMKLTGHIPPPDHTPQFKDRWKMPIESLVSQSANDGEVMARMSWAYESMRDSPKGYTITSPKSILKYALNWNGKRSNLDGEFEKVMAMAKQGRLAELDGAVRAAVMRVGSSRFKSARDRDKYDLQREFEEALNAAATPA